MIHSKSMNDNLTDDFRVKKKKLKKIEIALEKIGRSLGNEEYDSISIIEDKLDIKLKFGKIEELRGRYIWIWVIIPYEKEILSFLEKKLFKFNLPLNKFLKIINFNKQKFVKYPERIEICRVQKEIEEILKEEHGITNSYINSYKWEQIQNSKTWIKAQIQIAREIIADKLLKKYKL